MRYRLIVDDWGNLSGKDAEFSSFDELESAITEACKVNGWPVPELREGLPGAGDGVFERTPNGWRKIAEPVNDLAAAVRQKLGLEPDELEALFGALPTPRGGGPVGPLVAAEIRRRFGLPDDVPLGRALLGTGVLTTEEADWLDGGEEVMQR